MNPVAFIYSSGDKGGSGTGSLFQAPARTAYRRFAAVLENMGIPTVFLPVAEATGTYSAAIVVTALSAGSYSDIRDWVNGEKTIPVLVGANYGSATNSTTWKTGVTDDPAPSKVSAATKMFSSVSDPVSVDAWYAHTPIADATLIAASQPIVEPIFTVAPADEQPAGWAGSAYVGRTVAWVRDWSTVDATKSFVLWQSTDQGFLPALLYFLNRAQIVPPRPRKLFVCLDDYTDMADSGDTDGLEDVIDILRAADSYMLCGLQGTPSDTMAAFSAANSDVMKNIIHKHAGVYWYDDVQYDTVAAKLAALDADVVAWEAEGFTVEPGPFCGYFYCPSNAHSRLARLALATRGLKVMRGQGSSLSANQTKAVTFDSANLYVLCTAHGWSLNDRIKFRVGEGSLPAELSTDVWYYVKPVDGNANAFTISTGRSGTDEWFGDDGTAGVTATNFKGLDSTRFGVMVDGPMRETLEDPDTGQRYQIQIYEPWSPVAYNYKTWAEVLAGASVTTDVAYQSQQMASTSACRLMFQWPRTHLMFHGDNAHNGDDGADCPMLQWMQKIAKPLLELAGSNILRYATKQDWEEMAVARKNRA